jgi:SpoVK/Ycf46/Vps4 family AAA+-type ATPase
MREKDKNIPIILLMEDADSSLATRQLDNVSRLSDLLNMSDGILGDMADLRILATTNSRKDDIDKAVIREGRMNEYIQLQPLEETQANQVFLRLVPNQTLQEAGHLFGANTTLAYVYKEARRYGWRPELAPKKRKGYRDLLDYPISPYS